MIKRVRPSLSEIQINTLLRLGSTELLKQITHNATDPVLTEVVLKMVKAKERFMPNGKEDEDGNS